MTTAQASASRQPGGILLIAFVSAAVSWWVWQPNVMAPVAVAITVGTASLVLVVGCAISVALDHRDQPLKVPSPPNAGLERTYRGLIAQGFSPRTAALAVVGDPRYLDIILSEEHLMTLAEARYFRELAAAHSGVGDDDG